MMETNQTKNETNIEDEISDFYCEKCYDTINYFIDECQYLSPKANQYRDLYLKYKQSHNKLKKEHDMLQFEFEELKALVETHDEDKSLTCVSSNKLKIFNLIEYDEHESNKDVHKNISSYLTIDLDYLTKALYSRDNINMQSFIDKLGIYLNQQIQKSILNSSSNNELDLIKQENKSLICKIHDYEQKKLDTDLDKVTVELSDSQKANHDLNEELIKLREENTQLKSKLNEYEAKNEYFQTIETMNHDLELKLKNANEKINYLTDQIKQMECQVSDYQVQGKAESDNLKQIESSQKLIIDNLESQIEQLKTNLSILSTPKISCTIESQTEFKICDSNILEEAISISERLSQVNQQLSDKVEQMSDKYESEINKLKQVESCQNEIIAKLKAELEILNSKLIQSDNTLDDREKDYQRIASLEFQLSQAQTDFMNFKAEVDCRSILDGIIDTCCFVKFELAECQTDGQKTISQDQQTDERQIISQDQQTDVQETSSKDQQTDDLDVEQSEAINQINQRELNSEIDMDYKLKLDEKEKLILHLQEQIEFMKRSEIDLNVELILLNSLLSIEENKSINYMKNEVESQKCTIEITSQSATIEIQTDTFETEQCHMHTSTYSPSFDSVHTQTEVNLCDSETNTSTITYEFGQTQTEIIVIDEETNTPIIELGFSEVQTESVDLKSVQTQVDLVCIENESQCDLLDPKDVELLVQEFAKNEANLEMARKQLEEQANCFNQKLIEGQSAAEFREKQLISNLELMIKQLEERNMALQSEQESLIQRLSGLNGDLNQAKEESESNKLKFLERERSLTIEIDNLNNKINMLTDKLNQEQVSYQQAIEQFEKSYLQQVESLNQKLSDSISIIASLETDKQNFELIKIDFEAKHQEYISQINDLANQLSNKTDEINNLKIDHEKTLMDIKEAHKNEMDLIDKKLVNLDGLKYDLEIENNNLITEISALKMNIDEHSERLAQAEIEINSGKNLLAEKTIYCDQLETNLNQIKEEFNKAVELKEKHDTEFQEKIKSIENKNEEMIKSMSVDFEKLISTRMSETEIVKLDLESTKVELNELKEKFKNVEVELASIRDKSADDQNSLNKKLEDTSIELSEYKNEYERIKDCLNNKEKQCQELEAQIQMLKENEAKLYAEIDKLNKDFNDLSSSAKAAHEEFTKSESAKNKFSHDVSTLKAVISSLEKIKSDLEAELETIKMDKKHLMVKLEQYDELKELEIVDLKNSYGLNEFNLEQKIKQLTEELESDKHKIDRLRNDLSETENERSELRKQLAEYENELQNLRANMNKLYEEELNTYMNKSLEYELKFKNLTEEFEREKKNYKTKEQKFSEEETILSQEILQLKDKLHDFDTIKCQLGQQKKVHEEATVKINEQNLIIHEYDINCKYLTEQLNSANENRAVLQQQLTQLDARMNALMKDRDTVSKEFMEVQRQLCTAYNEKESLLKEMVENNKRNEIEKDFQRKLQEKLDAALSELSVIKSQAKEPSPKNSSSNFSDSFMIKLDKHIDSNLESKLEALMVEKHNNLNEIARLKEELKKLKHEKGESSSKMDDHETEQKYKSKIKKLTSENLKLKDEIKKLTEENAEMGTTNDFLTKQINNLNEQIYEFNNKENHDFEMVERSNRSQLPKNKLLDSSVDYCGTPTQNRNQTINDASINATPVQRSRPSIPNTPASSRKPNQCAQQ